MWHAAYSAYTRRLYTHKWKVFTNWCSSKNVDPATCSISFILSFLQERLDVGRTPSTLKVYVAAISAFHNGIDKQPVGKNDLVVKFLHSARRLNPPRPNHNSRLGLDFGPGCPDTPPFRTTAISLTQGTLSRKTTLLLALASVKRIRDLHAFSVNESCLSFGVKDCKVILMPRKGYVPKVLSTPFRSQVITLSAFTQSKPVDGEKNPPQPLCPVCALRIYVERTKHFRLSEQLFVCYVGHLHLCI